MKYNKKNILINTFIYLLIITLIFIILNYNYTSNEKFEDNYDDYETIFNEENLEKINNYINNNYDKIELINEIDDENNDNVKKMINNKIDNKFNENKLFNII